MSFGPIRRLTMSERARKYLWIALLAVSLLALEGAAVWWGVTRVLAIPQGMRSATPFELPDAAMLCGALGSLVTIPGIAMAVLSVRIKSRGHAP